MTSQVTNSWATDELPYQFRDEEILNERAVKYDSFIDSFNKFDKLSGSDSSLDSEESFGIDFDEGGKLTRGVFDITTAMTHMSMRDYYGGMFERNKQEMYTLLMFN